MAGASFFRSADGPIFVDVEIGGHQVTWPLLSVEFSDWLLHEFLTVKERVPTSTALKSAVRALSAHARFGDEQHEVFLRAAKSNGRIYVDLGDEKWQAIEIGKDGLKIIDNPPVRFRRPTGMRALPLPQHGGSIELRRFVNLDENDFVLLVAVLLDGLRPGKPHPILYLAGEEGTAKSTLAKIVRLLIDPNSTPLRTLPATVRNATTCAEWWRAYGKLALRCCSTERRTRVELASSS